MLAEDLKDAFLLCRTIGHAWYVGSSSHLSTADKGTHWFVVRCDRCGTERDDVVSNKTGDVVSRKYHYPDGYEIDEKAARSQLRVEWERRRAAAERMQRKQAS